MAKPLTKRQGNGKLYSRRASVEEAIDLAKTQNLEILLGRLQLTDRSAEYLETEVLVHLMRDARSSMNAQLLDVLFPTLLKRCQLNLFVSVPLGCGCHCRRVLSRETIDICGPCPCGIRAADATRGIP